MVEGTPRDLGGGGSLKGEKREKASGNPGFSVSFLEQKESFDG